MKPRGRPARKSLDRVSQKRDISPRAEIKLFKEKSGKVPFLSFLSERKKSEKAEIRTALNLLKAQGHMLRPPHTEHLGDQLYYLRVQAQDGTYRIFYWPYGRGVVILGHGFSKKTNKCPEQEIQRAEANRQAFLADPELHTHEGNRNEPQGHND